MIETRTRKTIDDLVKVDFVGGTLVEYLSGRHFSREWGRASIMGQETGRRFHPLGGKSCWWVKFATDGNAHFAGYDLSVEYVADGVWYLYSGPYLGLHYAVAPKGVAIPHPE